MDDLPSFASLRVSASSRAGASGEVASVADGHVDCIVADRPQHLPPLTIEQLRELVRLLLFCHTQAERMAIGLHFHQSRPLTEVAKAMDVSEYRARDVIASVRQRVKLAATRDTI